MYHFKAEKPIVRLFHVIDTKMRGRGVLGGSSLYSWKAHTRFPNIGPLKLFRYMELLSRKSTEYRSHIQLSLDGPRRESHSHHPTRLTYAKLFLKICSERFNSHRRDENYTKNCWIVNYQTWCDHVYNTRLDNMFCCESDWQMWTVLQLNPTKQSCWVESRRVMRTRLYTLFSITPWNIISVTTLQSMG